MADCGRFLRRNIERSSLRTENFWKPSLGLDAVVLPLPLWAPLASLQPLQVEDSEACHLNHNRIEALTWREIFAPNRTALWLRKTYPMTHQRTKEQRAAAEWSEPPPPPFTAFQAFCNSWSPSTCNWNNTRTSNDRTKVFNPSACRDIRTPPSWRISLCVTNTYASLKGSDFDFILMQPRDASCIFQDITQTF